MQMITLYLKQSWMVNIQRKKQNTKFLGTIINENLKWSDHVDYISKKVSSTVGLLYKLKHYVPLNILCMLYNSLILPYMSYCNILWADSKVYSDKILLLQKKAIRISAGAGFRDHTQPLFVKLKSLTVSDINFLQTSLFMYRHNSNLLPISFSSMFRRNNDVHTYPTRQAASIHLCNPRTALAHTCKYVRHNGPDVWNSLSTDTRNLLTIHSLKKQLNICLSQ